MDLSSPGGGSSDRLDPPLVTGLLPVITLVRTRYNTLAA